MSHSSLLNVMVFSLTPSAQPGLDRAITAVILGRVTMVFEMCISDFNVKEEHSLFSCYF